MTQFTKDIILLKQEFEQSESIRDFVPSQSHHLSLGGFESWTEKYGIPAGVLWIAKAILENDPGEPADHRRFIKQLIDCIPVDSDLSMVPWQFTKSTLQRLPEMYFIHEGLPSGLHPDIAHHLLKPAVDVISRYIADNGQIEGNLVTAKVLARYAGAYVEWTSLANSDKLDDSFPSLTYQVCAAETIRCACKTLIDSSGPSSFFFIAQNAMGAATGAGSVPGRRVEIQEQGNSLLNLLHEAPVRTELF